MKKLLKFGLIALIIVYLLLFVSYKSGYYEHLARDKKTLTDEMILKYEDDLKNGVDVTKETYIIERKNYTNLYTNTSLKVSSKFENVIDSSIKFIFKKINDMVSK